MSRAWPVDDIDPDASVAENARRILAVRLGEYFSYEPIVRREDAVEALHDLRIAAKRLRYTLELFKDVFGKRGERAIDRVKAIQEELGAIHDHDVRIALIEDELRGLADEQLDDLGKALWATPPEQQAALTTAALRPPPDDPRRGLLALLGREHARRRERYRAFVALWETLGREGFRADLAALSASSVGNGRGLRESAAGATGGAAR